MALLLIRAFWQSVKANPILAGYGTGALLTIPYIAHAQPRGVVPSLPYMAICSLLWPGLVPAIILIESEQKGMYRYEVLKEKTREGPYYNSGRGIWLCDDTIYQRYHYNKYEDTWERDGRWVRTGEGYFPLS